MAPKKKTDDLTSGVREDLANAEKVLQRLWEDGSRQPSYEEKILLDRVWDERQRRREYRRFSEAARLRNVAGSVANREAMQAEASTAADVCDRESPAIEQKIEELTKQLNQLQTDKSRSQKRLDEMNAAAERLRAPELLPSTVRAEYQRQLKEEVEPLKREYLDAKTEADHVRRQIEADVRTKEGYELIFSAARHCFDIDEGNRMYKLNHGRLGEYLAELRESICQHSRRTLRN